LRLSRTDRNVCSTVLSNTGWDNLCYRTKNTKPDLSQVPAACWQKLGTNYHRPITKRADTKVGPYVFSASGKVGKD